MRRGVVVVGIALVGACDADPVDPDGDSLAVRFDVAVTDGVVDIATSFTGHDAVSRTLDGGDTLTATLDGQTIALVDNGNATYVGRFASYTDLTLTVATNYRGEDIVSTAQLPTHMTIDFVPDPWPRSEPITVPHDTNDLSGEITSLTISGDCVIGLTGNLPKFAVDVMVDGTGTCPVTVELARLPPPDTARLGGGFYASTGFTQIYERVHVTVMSTP